ncbi:MAG: tetratricopeptide repeat protein [Afipia sp.]|jgi:Flp pilus assembly protein TadD
MRPQPTLVRWFGTAATAALLAASLGGCKTINPSDVTGSLGARAEATPGPMASHSAIEALGDRYRANPRDAEAGLRYGQALRADGRREQAVAVLEQSSIANPGNKALLAAYGRALAENGSFKQAFDILSRAHTPANPDWRILSVQGTALDQMGKHQEARRYYASALKIVPEEPSVLSNLGMSYILSKELPKAEDTLRRAYARGGSDARIRQNLALAIGLQGRTAEAEALVSANVPPGEAAANIASLRQMIGSGGRASQPREQRTSAAAAPRRS